MTHEWRNPENRLWNGKEGQHALLVRNHRWRFPAEFETLKA